MDANWYKMEGMAVVKAMRFTVLILCIGWLLLFGSAPALGADSSTITAEWQKLQRERTENRINLLWLIEGLRKLEESKNKKLNLTKDQAKNILSVMQELINKKILFTEKPEMQDAGSGRRWQAGEGQNRRELNPEELRRRIQELAEQEKFVGECLEKMESYLTSAQVDFLDNMKFDPSVYGLDRDRQYPGQGSGMPDPKLVEEMRKRRQEGLAKQADLTRKVLEMLKKRAGR